MFKKVKVGTGLIVGFGLVIAVFLAVSFFAINRMNVLSGLTEKLYRHPYAVSTSVLNIEADIIAMHRSMKDVALAKSVEDIEKAATIVDDYENKVMESFVLVEERFLGDKAMVNNAKTLFINWKVIRDEVIALMEKGDAKSKTAAAEITKGKGAAHVKQLNEAIKALEDFAQNKAVSFHANALQVRKFSFTLIYAFIVFALLLAIVLAISITKNIVSQLGCEPTEAANIAKKLSKGNLDIDFDNDRNEGLYGHLKSMVGSLRSIVENIKNGADHISNASQQLSSTSQQLSQGTNEQASSVEQVSSTMEEISANIQQNSQNAQETENMSVQANEGIKEVTQRANNTMEANKQIADKITIVNDIAFQTNILALNAAVEAARAGEHGKGFAVVASEVRKLAENSKTAAEEIVELAHKSLEYAKGAGTVMEQTRPKIESTTMLVQEITAASMEQNNGASQVNGAIQQLNNVTQQNAAVSEELATSAEEMNSQASALKETIAFFNLGNENSFGYSQQPNANKEMIYTENTFEVEPVKQANETHYENF